MPEIKIECNDLVKNKNDEGEEEDYQKQMPLCKLVKQMLTAVQKKEIIETIIPICCKLKKKLLSENKKLLPYLRKFIRELVKDYKSEFNEIFKEDKQFGIEILHELDSTKNSEVSEDENQEEMIQEMIFRSNDKPEKSICNIEMSDENTEGKKGSEKTDLDKSLSLPPGELPENDDDKNKKLNESLKLDEIDNNEIDGNDLNEVNTRRKSMDTKNSGELKCVNEELNDEKNSSKELDEPDGGIQNPHRSNCDGKRVQECLEDNKVKSLRICVNRLNSKMDKSRISSSCQATPSGNPEVRKKHAKLNQLKNSKKNNEEHVIMKKAVEQIVLPTHSKTLVKNKKRSLTNGRTNSMQSPTTPIFEGKKELLTSTPLITIDNPDFGMDLSSVVNETN